MRAGKDFACARALQLLVVHKSLRMMSLAYLVAAPQLWTADSRAEVADQNVRVRRK